MHGGQFHFSKNENKINQEKVICKTANEINTAHSGLNLLVNTCEVLASHSQYYALASKHIYLISINNK